MNPTVVLDASAVLAFLQGEPGWERVDACLRNPALTCAVAAANHAEIIAKALDKGIAPAALREILDALAYRVLEHPAVDGELAGYLRESTRQSGLSLGDRLCLAAAQRLNARVLTADKIWLKHAQVLGLDIECIRPDTD